MDWINPVAGFVVGLLVGITGVGGGSLMTPLLVLVFGMAPAVAVGTDLWFAAITKLVGGTVHHQRGGVDWQVVRRLAMGSLPAAVLTLAWLHASGLGPVKQGLILHMLGVVLVLTALAMLLKKQLHAVGQRLRSSAPERFKGVQP
ncbi:MAG: sulfite exporter TauE/SafE family protein, partial [Aquabacterium sp.]|nr:sulfite exporter TauE/SafE family protein [Aquabacterium sp.]